MTIKKYPENTKEILFIRDDANLSVLDLILRIDAHFPEVYLKNLRIEIEEIQESGFSLTYGGDYGRYFVIRLNKETYPCNTTSKKNLNSIEITSILPN